MAPVITGEISDWLQASGYDAGNALRYAICLILVFSVISSITFLASSRMIPARLNGDEGQAC
jgi:hypothetical protein